SLKLLARGDLYWLFAAAPEHEQQDKSWCLIRFSVWRRRYSTADLNRKSGTDHWAFFSDSVLVSCDFDTDSARTFFALANFKFYFVTLARRLSLHFRYMEKQITSAIASDETKTFFSIKKLYRACIHYNNLFLENFCRR